MNTAAVISAVGGALVAIIGALAAGYIAIQARSTANTARITASNATAVLKSHLNNAHSDDAPSTNGVTGVRPV